MQPIPRASPSTTPRAGRERQRLLPDRAILPASNRRLLAPALFLLPLAGFAIVVGCIWGLLRTWK